MTADELRELLRRKCIEAGGIRQFSREHSLCDVYVGNVINGKDKPGPAITLALGLRKIVTFEPKK